MPDSNVKSRTVKLTKMSMMIAISAAIMLIPPPLSRFPILPPPAHFLEFEVSDIPLLIAGFVFGPIRGFVIAVISIMIRAVVLMPPTGPYGVIMHIIAIGSFLLVSSFIYHRFKTKKWGLLSLIVGGLCMAAVMIPANLLVTPAFLGAPIEVVKEMLPIAIIPFNLTKAGVDTAVVFFLYKPLSPFLHRW